MGDALKSSNENLRRARLTSVSSLSSSEDEVEGSEKKVKQKKRRGIAEKFHELKAKPKKKLEKHKESEAMGSLSDIEAQQKPAKRHIGVIARIKRFGSRDELDTIPKEDKPKTKGKERNKSSEDDSDIGKHFHREDTKTSLLEKLRRFSEDSSSDEEEFSKEVLTVANKYRKNHGLRRLRANKELNSLAHEWARKLAREQNVIERYSHKYGKNIYSKELKHPDEKLKPEEVVDEWYREISYYTYGQNPQDPDVTKNVTQLLWKGSKEVGISKCRANDKNIIFVTAYFNPCGNIKDEYQHQVPPVGGFPSRKRFGHSSSESSSEDDEGKRTDKQEISSGKSNKKNFLSQVFDKFRKNSDGDSDNKKKEKKEHHGFIGLRTGKYNIAGNKEQTLPKDKENEKEKEKSNFYIVSTKEVKEIKQNLRKQEVQHEATVFDSKDLDLNKTESKSIVLAQRENSKISSSSSSDEENVEHVQREKLSHQLKEDLSPILTKVPQEISKAEVNYSNGTLKSQLKSEETKIILTEKEISNKSRRSSSSSSSDEDNITKVQPLSNQNSKNSDLLSDIKSQLKGMKDRKSSSSEDEKDATSEIKDCKESVKEQQSNDQKSKTTKMLSEIKYELKSMRSRNSSSSEDEKNPSEIKDQKESFKEQSTKDHIPKNSHMLSEIKQELKSMKTHNSSSSSEDETNVSSKIKNYNDNSDVETKVSSDISQKTGFFSQMKIKILQSIDRSSSDEEELKHDISSHLAKYNEVKIEDKARESKPLSFGIKRASVSKDSSSDEESRDSKVNETHSSHIVAKGSSTEPKNKKKRMSYNSSDEELNITNKSNDIPVNVEMNDKRKTEIFSTFTEQINKKHSSSSDDELLECKATTLTSPEYKYKSKDSLFDKKEENHGDDFQKHYIARQDSSSSDEEKQQKPVVRQNVDDENKNELSMFDKLKSQFKKKVHSISSSEDEKNYSNRNKEASVVAQNSETLGSFKDHNTESRSGSSSDEENNVNQHIHDSTDNSKLAFSTFSNTQKTKSCSNSSSDEETLNKHDIKEKLSSDINSEHLKSKSEEISENLKDSKFGSNDSSSDENKKDLFGKLKNKLYKKDENNSSSSDEEATNGNSDVKCSKIDNFININVPLRNPDFNVKDSSERKNSNNDERENAFKKEQPIISQNVQLEYNKKEEDSSSSDEEIHLKQNINNDISANPNSNVVEKTSHKSNEIGNLKIHLKRNSDDSSSSSDEEINKEEKTVIDKILISKYKPESANKNMEIEEDSTTKRSSFSSTDNEVVCSSNVTRKVGLIQKMKDRLNISTNDDSKSSSSDEDNESKNKNISITDSKNQDTLQRMDSLSTNEDKNTLKDASQKRSLYGQMKSFLTMKSNESSSSDDGKEDLVLNHRSSIDIIICKKDEPEAITKHNQDNDAHNDISNKKSTNTRLIKGKGKKSDEDIGSSSDEDQHINPTNDFIKEVCLDSNIRATNTEILVSHQIESSSDSDASDGKSTRIVKIEEFEELSVRQKNTNKSITSSSSSDEEQKKANLSARKRERDSYVDKLKHVFENINEKSFIKHETNAIETVIINHKHIEEMLNYINNYRSYHEAEKLIFNKQMCKLAMDRANNFACGIAGNLLSCYGENIFIYPSSGSSVKDATILAVDAWYKTIIFHQFGVEPDEYNLKADPFTQLVWKSTKEIGIGIYESDRESRIFIVAIFSPAGNVKGHFKKEVRSRSSSPEPKQCYDDRLI